MFIVIAHTHLNPQEFASVYSQAGWAIFNEMQVGIPVQNKTCKDFFCMAKICSSRKRGLVEVLVQIAGEAVKNH